MKKHIVVGSGESIKDLPWWYNLPENYDPIILDRNHGFRLDKRHQRLFFSHPFAHKSMLLERGHDMWIFPFLISIYFDWCVLHRSNPAVGMVHGKRSWTQQKCSALWQVSNPLWGTYIFTCHTVLYKSVVEVGGWSFGPAYHLTILSFKNHMFFQSQ